MPDHIHIFLSMKPSISISALVRDIKNNSSTFINNKGWVRGKFNWQEGYGAFSYGHSQIDAVVQYIRNQEKHHAKRTFKQEYLGLLKKFNIEYDERYVFDWALEEDKWFWEWMWRINNPGMGLMFFGYSLMVVSTCHSYGVPGFWWATLSINISSLTGLEEMSNKKIKRELSCKQQPCATLF